MKNYIVLILLFCAGLSFAQSDQGFNYQAVVQNSDGEIIKDDFVSLRFWILKGNSNGDVLYRESHSAVYTGVEGILSLQIGTGSSDVGDFESIDWSADKHFIRVDLDENNGNDYTQMGITQLMAVPYAMYAFNAGGGASGDDWGSQTVNSDNTLSGNGTASSPLTVNTSAVNTDNQSLSIDGNQLSISNGNTISIPTGGTDADADPTNELQELSNSKSGDNVTVTITDGNSTTFNVRDGDFSSSNELQDLSFSNNTLSISNGNAVSIAEGKWTENSSANAVYYDGKVNVGIDNFSNNTTGAALYVNGEGMFRSGSSSNSYSQIGGQGTISLYKSGTEVASLGNGSLTLKEPFNGNNNQVIIDADASLIAIRNNNQPMIDLTKTSAGGGRIDITNQFGNNATVQLATDAVMGMGSVSTYFASSLNTLLNVSSASNEYGGIAIYDANETAQAGLTIDTNGDGIVFADVKNFRMDHPENTEEEIWYASLEGPEAGAYERGTAQLVNGEALVPFSDHYSLVIAEEGMTVMLSPLSAESLGLAVIEKTKEGFKVKELYGGTGNYSFDWEVKGVRKGFEDYKVIREKKDMVVKPKR
ncbi:MAG: hypothetical protein P8P48_10625 [Saprospiraceae bacterium]|nr:hypothetical protein [Saprospiraceae bacterium]